MGAQSKADWTHSLAAWIVRDALLLAAFVSIWQGLRAWHAASASWPSAIALGASSFVFAYAACYVAHEWGHELGARALGSRAPRGSIRGIAIPLFDPRTHTRAQFFGLAFGGQLGYVAMAALLVALLQPELGARVAALGGVAFVVQSLYVDSAALIPALRGLAPADALKSVTPRLILRRTGVAWSALAAVLVGFHLTRGLP
jgi:hypothetical protein